MSKPYPSIEEKRCQPHYPLWSHEATETMRTILHKKNYHVIVPTTREGYDERDHNCWVVYREDICKFIEQCFRQRLNIEVEAIGHFEADIIFVSDPSEEQMLKLVRRFQKVEL